VIAAAVAPLAMLTAVLFAEAAPVEASKEQVAPHTRITIDPKLLDAYAGFYLNAVTDSLMIVTREDDHLLTRRAGEQPVAEYPYTDHDFFLTVVPKQNSFITDASGAVLRVVHHQWGRDETLERISVEAAQRHEEARLKRVAEERTPRTAISIDPQLLDNYVGAYQLKPQLVFTVTREGDRLLAKLTGQQTYEVHPYTERDFSYTIVAAQLSFVPGADGKASAVVLHQNGKDQTAPRVDLSVAQALDVKLAEQSAPRTAVKIDPRLLDSYSAATATRSWKSPRPAKASSCSSRSPVTADTPFSLTPSATSSRPSSRPSTPLRRITPARRPRWSGIGVARTRCSFGRTDPECVRRQPGIRAPKL